MPALVKRKKKRFYMTSPDGARADIGLANYLKAQTKYDNIGLNVSLRPRKTTFYLAETDFTQFLQIDYKPITS